MIDTKNGQVHVNYLELSHTFQKGGAKKPITGRIAEIIIGVEFALSTCMKCKLKLNA